MGLQSKSKMCGHLLANLVMKEIGQRELTKNCTGHVLKRHLSSSTVSVVDLRSDTMTKPTPAMREAMKNAVVGDDGFGEDPTVHRLQEKMADLFGMEDSLFVPTCTLANTISSLVHCDARFNEIIMGTMSHTYLYEVSGLMGFAGVSACGVPSQPDGTMKVEDIAKSIRPFIDVHKPWTRLISLENSHNLCGGRVISLEYMRSVKRVAEKHNLKVHLDGARVFNAATALGVRASDITRCFDTVTTAFSKGLCGPAGAVIAGNRDFIQLATKARKALGCCMRQVGVLAAPLLETMDYHIDRLGEDHDRTRKIAEAINSLGSNPVCHIDMSGVHSNIVMMDMIGAATPTAFIERLREVSDDERKALGESISVRMLPFPVMGTVRYVLHHDINDEDVMKAIKKITYVIEELSEVDKMNQPKVDQINQ